MQVEPIADAHAVLTAILGSSNEAMVSKDLQGIVHSWNPAAERIFGYSAREMIGKPITVIVPAERADEEARILKTLSRGERVEPFQTVRRRKDGTLVDVSLVISPIRDKEGRIVGGLKIARDVTEELRLLKELQEREERYRVTLSSIGDGVISADVLGHVTFVNPVAERLTGFHAQEALAQPLESVFDIMNETTRRRVMSPVSKVIEQGVVVGLANHTLLRAKDGTERPISDSAAPIRDSNGRLTGVVLVFRDATEERATALVSERLAALVENSDDAIVGKDLNGIVTSWNKGAERIFGYTAEEMIGRPITVLFPPDRLNEEQEILARLRRGERVDHFETVRVTRDRRQLDVSLTLSPIRDADGRIVGASKIARDITDRKRSERALREAQSQLEAHAQELEKVVQDRTAQLQGTIAELETFSYSLSHDLRAPLRAIHQYAQVLLQDYAPKIDREAQAHLERIVSAAGKLDTLVRDVLSYSRVMRAPIELKPINVEALVAEVIQHYPSLRPLEAAIAVQGPLAPVIGHDAFLTQCLSNLLTNAAKFVAPDRKPQIRLWTEKRGDRVRVLVADNGVGIPEKDQQRIFGIFERVPNASAYEGTGIGLAIVRKAAERMGGSVGVTSKLGEGSTFWIELPAAEPS